MSKILISKATGVKEEFNPDKLRDSLRRAGALHTTIDKIVSHIENELREGMTTKDIYRHAFDLLKEEEDKGVVIRYSLRRAIMDMGPTGFPFEQFVAEIFKAKGFQTEVGVEMLGECVTHEVDVVAWNKEKLVIVEAKFHNQSGVKSDLKVVLYIKARFDDLSQTYFDYGKKRKIDESYLITNTKFSKQAIKYAECKNMHLIGWNYPKVGNLQDLIEEGHLHPITSLSSLSNHQKMDLMNLGIVLCKQARDNQDIVKQILDDHKLEKMLEEINHIQK